MKGTKPFWVSLRSSVTGTMVNMPYSWFTAPAKPRHEGDHDKQTPVLVKDPLPACQSNRIEDTGTVRVDYELVITVVQAHLRILLGKNNWIRSARKRDLRSMFSARCHTRLSGTCTRRRCASHCVPSFEPAQNFHLIERYLHTQNSRYAGVE
jgi:hypothetical protein